MSADRRRWAGTLVAAIVLAAGLVCLVNGARRIGRPFPGFLLANNRIVLSIGRTDWSPSLDDRIPFAQVSAVVDTPIDSASAIQAHAESLPSGTPVTYRFRQGTDVFTASVLTREFTSADFLALYANYFVVGLAFSLAGLWALWRARANAATWPFFLLCQTGALALLRQETSTARTGSPRSTSPRTP